jgi:hypothetical protein
MRPASLRAPASRRRFASEVSVIHRTFLAAALALTAGSTRADPAAAAGRIETEDSRFEILGRPLRAGDRIDVPEGYLVVEESGPEDGQVGSFGVVPVESFAQAGPAAAPAEPGGPADAAPGAALAACSAERGAYLLELWRASGIEVKDPVAFLEGLQGGAVGPASGYYWFATATDAFRPLAWSSELRSRADALARCVRANANAG